MGLSDLFDSPIFDGTTVKRVKVSVKAPLLSILYYIFRYFRIVRG